MKYLKSNGKYHIGMGPLFHNLEQLVDFYCKNKLDLPCLLKLSLNPSTIFFIGFSFSRELS